jgi:Tfp pilus assembly protein PilN
MIDINLAPDNLRKKKRKQFLPAALNIPQEAVIGLVGGLFVLLLAVHVVLQLVIVVRFMQHAAYNRDWAKLKPDKEKVDVIASEMREIQGKIRAIDGITTSKRIPWSRKFNEISDSLSRGVWLNKISFKDNVLLIEGGAVSKSKDEMIGMVGTFAGNLKHDQEFMSELKNLEMGQIQRRKLQSTEFVDFSMSAKVK